MNKKWILIADRSKARVFEYQGPGKPFKLIHKLDHPEGRLKSKDFNMDEDGESFDRMGYGRHKVDVDTDPREEINKRFALEVCNFLKQSKLEKKFDHLYIASGPVFISYIKEKLDPNVYKNVQAWIPKNLGNIEDRDIHEYFKEHLNV